MRVRTNLVYNNEDSLCRIQKEKLLNVPEVQIDEKVYSIWGSRKRRGEGVVKAGPLRNKVFLML